ncbi:hypothetical protein ACFSUP_04240 [Gracilibacillus thailandensis]|uniref:hypothetical protein n=1 Tax=Gracilibacillus thailandensis TaxID=563735 RepID=UPI00362AAD5B
MPLPSVLSRGESVEQQRQRQEAGQDHARNLANALDDHDLDAEYIDKLTNSQLEQGTVNILNNMLSKDWVLANMSDAEVNETRWFARLMSMRVEALHPEQGSVWTGEFRKFCADDPDDALKPLDSAQRTIIFELIHGVIARATRSRDGWQQDKMNESISVSQRLEGDGEDDGGWW